MTRSSDSQAGIARIKAEFLLEPTARPLPTPDDDAAEAATAVSSTLASTEQPEDENGDGEPPTKKIRLSGAEKKRRARQEAADKRKDKKKGMNTNRKFARVQDEVQLCFKAAVGEPCDFGASCRFVHDIPTYLAAKPLDIYFPPASSLSPDPPFVGARPPVEAVGVPPSVDSSTTCPPFEESGICRQGFKCRFLGAHLSHDPELKLVVNEEKSVQNAVATTEVNVIQMDKIKAVRSRNYPTPITDAYLTELSRQNPEEEVDLVEVDAKPTEDVELESKKTLELVSALPVTSEPMVEKAIETPLAESAPTETPADDSPDVPMRAQEKKRLHWKGLTYLAPLTTVGNLPFRRLCVDYGADITCGEMALATSLLGGSKEEWSLIRRHPSERIFGVQLAGGKPATLGRISEVLNNELGENGIDFVDVNCGCPIDMVYKSGAGSALLDAPSRLGKIVVGMNRALGDIPVTIKVRTGVKDGRNTAHKLMTRLDGWGVGAITIHGRTRQQRYTRLADWSYIKECVGALRATNVKREDQNLAQIPIFGGGDVYTSQGYWETLEQSGVDGIMIGRGALIKPWIFTEIKERREWDISSRERLDLVRKYAEYGLNHWGSDTQGVNTTRRFLCEALSFQSRYVPLGILETFPRLNDRPPSFRGRDELETLLSSGNSQDWVKVSEMFLGPPPEGWSFTPKHKSNAYGGDEEGNG